MKDVRLEIEELEQRVVPTLTLSVAVELADAAIDQGVEAPTPTAEVDDAAAAADGAGPVSVG